MAYYQEHMLSIKSRTVLANLLAEVVLLNQTIESYRQALANTPYFDSLALFRFIDRQEKGYICEKDFHRLIGSQHRKLLTYAFTWVDNLKAGEISRLEFATFLLPRDNLDLRELVAQRVQLPELTFSQPQAILQQFEIFRELVLEIMRREMRAIELRRQLLGGKDYSIRGVLLAIDCHRMDWVCSEEVFKFMKNFGFDVNLRHVEKLVETLDFRQEGRLAEDQLKWTVEGLEGKDRSYLGRIKSSNKRQPSKKPVNFQYDFEYHRQVNAHIYQIREERNPVNGIYSELVQRIKSVEVEEKKTDSALLYQQEVSLENAREEQQRQRVNLLQRKRRDEERRVKEMEGLMAQRQMERQLQGIIDKTASLQAESERLRRLEQRLAINEDTFSIRKARVDVVANVQGAYADIKLKDIYSNCSVFDHNLDYNVASINNARVVTPLTREYSASYGRTEDIYHHYQSPDYNLEAVRHLRDKVRQEREVQKTIRQQFYHSSLSKYGSYLYPRQQLETPIINRQDQVRTTHEKASHSTLKGQQSAYFKDHSSADFKDHSSADFKDHISADFKDHISAEPKKEEIVQQRQGVRVNLMRQFQSPQPQPSQQMSKLDISTTNKQ